MKRRDHFVKLTTLACRGNQRAKTTLWEYLYRARTPFIRAILSARGVPYDDLEDAAQQVLVDFMENLDRIRDPKKARGYCFRIAQNVARDHRARKPVEPLPDDSELPGVNERHEVRVDIDAAFAKLPRHVAEAVVLVDEEGRSYKEAAQVLGYSVSKLKKLLRKGRDTIRAAFGTKNAATRVATLSPVNGEVNQKSQAFQLPHEPRRSAKAGTIDRMAEQRQARSAQSAA